MLTGHSTNQKEKALSNINMSWILKIDPYFRNVKILKAMCVFESMKNVSHF